MKLPIKKRIEEVEKKILRLHGSFTFAQVGEFKTFCLMDLIENGDPEAAYNMLSDLYPVGFLTTIKELIARTPSVYPAIKVATALIKHFRSQFAPYYQNYAEYRKIVNPDEKAKKYILDLKNTGIEYLNIIGNYIKKHNLQLSAFNLNREREGILNGKMEAANPPIYSDGSIDEGVFWQLIKESSLIDDELDTQVLREKLLEYGTKDLKVFGKILKDKFSSLNRSTCMQAFFIIKDSPSDDDYDYFKAWIISKGEKVFTDTMMNADTLAKYCEAGDECSCEDLLNVHLDVYFIRSGGKLISSGLVASVPKKPKEDRILQANFPKLWSKFRKGGLDN